MVFSFWAAVSLIAYTYVLFPMIVLLRGVLRPRPYAAAAIEPTISIVIAAHDEAAVIGEKLDNLLALDYPRDRVQIVVSSDGSSDDTEDIVRRRAADGVQLVALPRVGKAQALNAAVRCATGEVLVFSDANSMFRPDALRALVRPLADPSVGGVAGDQRYHTSDGSGTAGEISYWTLDRLLKVAQSRAGSATSATGAIYAIRRQLFRDVPEDVTDDFAVSTGVVLSGHRLLFASDAVAYEAVAEPGSAEFSRKVRIMTRGLRGVAARRQLLDPRRHGFYSLQLLSHKVLRRTMAIPLAVALCSACALAPRDRRFRPLAVAQCACYGAGGVGLLLRRTRLGRSPVLAVPAYFLMVNAASVRALWNVATGNRIRRWEPSRTGTSKRSDPPNTAVSTGPLEHPSSPAVRDVVSRLRGSLDERPDLAVVVPVNAQEDLEKVLGLLGDLSRYTGPHRIELILVINNYDAEKPPEAIEAYRGAGIVVVAEPSVFRSGQAICFSARTPGVRAAATDHVVTFDADCRIPNPTALLDWYIERFEDGADVAYSEVRYYDLRPKASVHARMLAHYLSRWVKRTVLRIPTTRGSNYGVRPSTFLPLCDRDLMADDLNVGPTVKAAGGAVAYSGSADLVVLTSGRRFKGGWLKLAKYLRYRLRYNRLALPVGTNAERRTRGLDHGRPHRPVHTGGSIAS